MIFPNQSSRCSLTRPPQHLAVTRHTLQHSPSVPGPLQHRSVIKLTSRLPATMPHLTQHLPMISLAPWVSATINLTAAQPPVPIQYRTRHYHVGPFIPGTPAIVQYALQQPPIILLRPEHPVVMEITLSMQREPSHALSSLGCPQFGDASHNGASDGSGKDISALPGHPMSIDTNYSSCRNRPLRQTSSVISHTSSATLVYEPALVMWINDASC